MKFSAKKLGKTNIRPSLFRVSPERAGLKDFGTSVAAFWAEARNRDCE